MAVIRNLYAHLKPELIGASLGLIIGLGMGLGWFSLLGAVGSLVIAAICRAIVGAW